MRTLFRAVSNELTRTLIISCALSVGALYSYFGQPGLEITAVSIGSAVLAAVAQAGIKALHAHLKRCLNRNHAATP
jgi:uncharacterized protein (DUF849 family)